MKLVLERKYPKEEYVIGNLFINNKFFCNTLEDTDRGLNSSMSLKEILSIKKKGITAIPKGIYEIIMNRISPKFSAYKQYKFCEGKLPYLLNVKGFEGVLIHIGNFPKDTDGCVLVGINKTKGSISDSTIWFNKLYSVLKKASDNNEKIEIEIK